MFCVKKGGDNTNIILFFFILLSQQWICYKQKNSAGTVPAEFSTFICLSLFKLHILHINFWVHLFYIVKKYYPVKVILGL